MYEIYCKLRNLKGCKDSDVAKSTGITKSTFTDWKNGRSVPKHDKLQKIADFFDVSIAYLMGSENSKKENNNQVDKIPENIRAVTRQLINLDEENQKLAIEMINFLAAKGDEAKKK